MNIERRLQNEKKFLQRYETKAITLSTTAKEPIRFNVLPRRTVARTGVASFIVNDEQIVKQIVTYFDHFVDHIYVDIEQKQQINLFQLAKKHVEKAKLMTAKPNDTTVESLDLLIRHYANDDLTHKNIAIIGTGNLASKIAIRLAERQANVFIKGRSDEKEEKIVNALNLFLPSYSPKINRFQPHTFHFVISALSGPFTEEAQLERLIDSDTVIIDVGINNFSRSFIEKMVQRQMNILRLDTRVAFPYQLLMTDQYTTQFFNDMYGKAIIDDVTIVSGGYIGKEGTVIVDQLKKPNQIIGIADGCGGVKDDRRLTTEEREAIKTVEQFIVRNC